VEERIYTEERRSRDKRRRFFFDFRRRRFPVWTLQFNASEIDTGP
jgi:hypothetical protein